jgi:peptidoglycan/LPS O-acetylase OafA/YrhL
VTKGTPQASMLTRHSVSSARAETELLEPSSRRDDNAYYDRDEARGAVTPPSVERRPYRYFGLLRFALAFLVMFAHFVNNIAAPTTRDVYFPLSLGNIAVLVFFALSGFIIIEAINDSYSRRPGAFAVNRLLRIVPPYLAALALAVVVHYVLFRLGTLKLYYGGTVSAADFSLHALVWDILIIFPGFNPHEQFTFIGIVWAIRVEFQFYLIVAVALGAALLCARTLRLRMERIFILLLLAAVAAHLAFYVAWAAGHAPATFGFAPYFIFGGALYYAINGSRRALALVLLMIPFVAHHFLVYVLPTLAVFQVDQSVGPAITPVYKTVDLLLLLSLLAGIGVLAVLDWPPLRRFDRFLGELSYPLYLNHMIAGVVAASFIPADWGDGRMLLAFVIGLSVSYALYAAVEPTLKRARNVVRGHAIE